MPRHIHTAPRSVPFVHSPLLTLKLPAWRSRAIFFLLCISFAILVTRAFYLQAFSTRFLQKQGESRYARTLELPATRGKITDRNGSVLASSLPAKTIWAIPEDTHLTTSELSKLAHLIEAPPQDLKQKLANDDRNFVYLKRQIPTQIAAQIKALDLEGIYERNEYKRYYPEGETTANLIGLTNIDDQGQEGLEFSFNAQLAGQAGARRVIKDRLGRIIEDIGANRPPHDGQDLTLAIDNKIQFLAYSKLKESVIAHHAKAGAAVVLDAKTGELLALANLPSYNPNQRAHLNPEALRNRAVINSFEPGSVIKPFVIGLALEEKIVKPSTIIQTAPGKLTIGTATINDAHTHNALTVEEVLQKSSNVGTAKIALQIAPRNLWEMFTQIGFGQAPKIGLPGAIAGRVRPYKKWRPIEQATMAYGHGIAVSLVQLARAYTIFTNNGVLLPLQLLRVEKNSVPNGTRVFSVSTTQAISKMLEMVTSPGGTAPRAQIVGYRVAGKTGTAHKLGINGYEDRYISSFIGFVPASNPRLIIAVILDEPSTGKYYGGEVAAPVFAEIASGAVRALQIAPDAPFKTLVIPADSIAEGT